MMKTLLGIFLSLAGLVHVQAAMFQVPVAGGNSLTLTGNVGLSASFPLRIENLTNVNITVPSTNRLMVMSGVDKQMTNAFKRFYYDTNSAASLSNRIAEATSGDVVELGAGTFNIGVQSLKAPVGVTVRGQGMGRTIIVGKVGATTNTPIQLNSSNTWEDMTIVAGEKTNYFMYPIGNAVNLGHTPATNVTLRRIEIDGETDCVVISQNDNTSGTVEDCNFHSAWDVFNTIDLTTGDGVPGARWVFRRTRFYSDSGTAVNTQGVLDPKSQPFICEGAYIDLINCEITATNNKARAVICTGFETNLVRIYDGFINSAGTNGFGTTVDIATDSDNSVSTVNVSGTLINDSNLGSGTVVTYEPRQIGSLRASTIRSLDDLFVFDGTFTRTLTVTNEMQAATVNTTDLNATGSSVLNDTVVGGTFIFTTGTPGAGKVLTDTDGSGTIGWQAASGGGTWTADQNAGGFSLTNALSIVLNSTARGSLQLNGTNGTPVVITAASSNSVPVTNVVGLIHKASAAVIVVDCNNANKFQITNQLGQGTSIIVTNLAQGQEISISGSADGTSRTVTVIPQLGFLVRDFDTFGVAAAANKAITATNGNTFEINIAAKWGFGTNFADVVTRQAKY